ncbi:uncharacterized protein LOC142344501 [Convolutriloba macropyga]|uniref:uncharacterized protein LOC142344501 n=1 Tax=Convolutriloba macropyga TaxID=536237 RepID=UPI003F5290CE
MRSVILALFIVFTCFEALTAFQCVQCEYCENENFCGLKDGPTEPRSNIEITEAAVDVTTSEPATTLADEPTTDPNATTVNETTLDETTTPEPPTTTIIPQVTTSDIRCKENPESSQLTKVECELPNYCYFTQLDVNEELVALFRGCSSNTSFTNSNFRLTLPDPLDEFGEQTECSQLINTEEGGYLQPFYTAVGILVEKMSVCFNICAQDNCNVINSSEFYYLRVKLVLLSQFLFAAFFALFYF